MPSKPHLDDTPPLPDPDAYLGDIETVRPIVDPIVNPSSCDDDDLLQTARRRFFERYHQPVSRYLVGIMRDEQAAEELAQDFARGVLEKAFRGYNPERGRFRDYLKASLRNKVLDYWRKKSRQRMVAGLDEIEPVAKPTVELPRRGDLEDVVDAVYRRLKEIRQTATVSYYQVLLYSYKHPDATSEKMAAALTQDLKLAKPLSAMGVRKTLERARDKFAEFFILELIEHHDCTTRERLEERLAELRVLEICRASVARHFGG